MSSPVLTVEGIISVEYLVDILTKPFSTYPVLNSAGNFVGMIPKNFLIVLIENHHWVDLRKLDPEKREKLIKMYKQVRRSSEFDQQNLRGTSV